MREFIADLSAALNKGLRAFQDNPSGAPLLDECYNFQVGESGLEEYQPLSAVGWKSAYFHYLPIRDQLGVLWYWYPVFDGHILVDTSIPSEPTTGMDAIAYCEAIEWVEILDENNEVWKLYPDSSSGFTRATDSTVLIGTGLQGLIWRGTTGESWMLRFSEADLVRYAVRVG